MQNNWPQRKPLIFIDKYLFFSLVLLSCVGLIILYSASNQNTSLILRQIVRLLIGFIIMLSIAQMNLQKIISWIPWIYLIGVILLALVLIIGDSSKGAQRWLNLGLFRFQPSELMKITLPLMLAWYIGNKPLPPTYTRLLLAIIMIVIPVVLIFKEPDLGTSLLIASSGVFVILLAGMNWRLIASFVAVIVAFIPILWFYIMHEYQQNRVLTFLNPESDPLGAGYHIIQSKIAIGSGGLYGKGWLKGTQSQLQFLPERTTDFIFAVYSEEFGLMGILFLLMIYFFILTKGLYVALHAQDSFSRLLVGSLILTFFVYIFVNISMVTGLLPVVGLPLPLISYGGTSIVTLMAGFGLIMSVHTHRRFLSY
ncbi:MAG: rod shape-determining protein RodA [Thiomargarita sp.]|nr:rod shape-determining protein RodA [Thiomargarita sp.]